MTAHSPQAIAAYPATGNMADGSKFVGKNDAAKRTAFDRGRAEALAGRRSADRKTVAWLLWCASEGYLKSEDRQITKNWFLSDPANDHPDDEREGWLSLADDVLAALPVVVSDSTKPSDETQEAAWQSRGHLFCSRDQFDWIWNAALASRPLSDSTALIEEARGWHYDTDPELMETLTGRLLAALAALHPTSEGDN